MTGPVTKERVLDLLKQWSRGTPLRRSMPIIPRYPMGCVQGICPLDDGQILLECKRLGVVPVWSQKGWTLSSTASPSRTTSSPR